MHVHEDRLGQVHDGAWSPASLYGANPLIVEAVDELFHCIAIDGHQRRSARTAALSFAAALGLDRGDARRIRLPVAARAVLDVTHLAADEVERELHKVVGNDALLAIVCDGLVGYRSGRRRRPPSEREAVARALCAIARMAAAQEEIDLLEVVAVPDERD